MTPNELLGGFSVAAIFAAAWQQVRMLLLKLVSLFIVRVKVHFPLADQVSGYCFRHFQRSPFGLLTFRGAEIFVRPMKRQQLIGYEVPSREPMVFWKGMRVLFLSFMPVNSMNNVSEGESITITTLRGLFDIDVLLLAALDEFNQRAGGVEKKFPRFRVDRRQGSNRSRDDVASNSKVGEPPSQQPSQHPRDFRMLRWQVDDIGIEVAAGNALDLLALPDKAHELVTELRHWLYSEEWYRERGIPWRRGWLLYGKPGTGKTSLVRAIAQDLDLPVSTFDLSTMNNYEFTREWRDTLTNAPCIALIEDIDAVFEGRKNITEAKDGLSFDCLLNCISGIETASGVFVVITTNRVEMLDEAIGVPRAESNGTLISTRPGRVDRALELGPMNAHCRGKIARRILAECPQHIERLVQEGDGDTGAQFQERCAQVALAEHWRLQSIAKNDDAPEVRGARSLRSCV